MLVGKDQIQSRRLTYTLLLLLLVRGEHSMLVHTIVRGFHLGTAYRRGSVDLSSTDVPESAYNAKSHSDATQGGNICISES